MGGGGPMSQELPGSINILAVAQGRLHFLALAPELESSSVKTRTGLSSLLEPGHPQFSQKLV